MEIDGDLEVVRIAIAASALLDGGDLGIQSFRDSVGDKQRLYRWFAGRGDSAAVSAESPISPDYRSFYPDQSDCNHAVC